MSDIVVWFGEVKNLVFAVGVAIVGFVTLSLVLWLVVAKWRADESRKSESTLQCIGLSIIRVPPYG